MGIGGKDRGEDSNKELSLPLSSFASLLSSIREHALEGTPPPYSGRLWQSESIPLNVERRPSAFISSDFMMLYQSNGNRAFKGSP